MKTHAEHPGGAGGRVSRRDFLKMGALTGAAVGMGGGLTGVLAACGGDSGSTSGGSDGEGREIKIGFVTPLTGPLASFGIPDAWCVKQWEASVADGLECGDGQACGLHRGRVGQRVRRSALAPCRRLRWGRRPVLPASGLRPESPRRPIQQAAS